MAIVEFHEDLCKVTRRISKRTPIIPRDHGILETIRWSLLEGKYFTIRSHALCQSWFNIFNTLICDFFLYLMLQESFLVLVRPAEDLCWKTNVDRLDRNARFLFCSCDCDLIAEACFHTTIIPSFAVFTFGITTNYIYFAISIPLTP